MGYRIEYDSGTHRYEVTQDKPWRPWVLTVGCFGLFMLLSSWFWPEGYSFLRSLLIPGEDAFTVQAFANLSDQLEAGMGFRDAVTAFCREIIVGEAAVR